MTNMIYTAMPALPKKHHTNAVVLPSEWNTCPLSSIVEEISERGVSGYKQPSAFQQE